MAKADLRTMALELRDQVDRYRTPPARSVHDHALYEAWESILRPRIQNVLSSLEWLADAGAWVMDDEDKALHLVEDRWDAAISRAAEVYVALSGAHSQYQGLRIAWKAPLRFGVLAGKPSAAGKGKEAAAAKEAARKAEEAAKKKGFAKLEAVVEEIVQALDAQREALRAQGKALQALVSRMQKAEEDRLHGDCEVCFETDPKKSERVRDLVQTMRVGRLNAESFGGSPPAKYGSLLRQGWRVHHLRLLGLLRSSAPTAPGRPASTKGRRRTVARRRPGG